MPLGKPRYPFNAKMLEGAPRDAGVYILYSDRQVLYIGRAARIQAALREHMDGARCDCSRRATHYSWEISLQPGARELELLQGHREAVGDLPACNLHAA